MKDEKFSDDFWSDQREKFREEAAKLQMLCVHFGIKPGPLMSYELALAMAQEIWPEPKIQK